jgi:ABC-type sugar transport system substrate-binding protein
MASASVANSLSTITQVPAVDTPVPARSSTCANRPTALFCFNDRMAMGAYYAAAERGLRIPHDLSIIGFDNQDLIVNGLRPGLTTIELPHYEMGRWAVLELLSMIESGKTDRPLRWPCRVPLFEGGRRPVSRVGNKVPEAGHLDLTRTR